MFESEFKIAIFCLQTHEENFVKDEAWIGFMFVYRLYSYIKGINSQPSDKLEIRRWVVSTMMLRSAGIELEEWLRQ